jgi:hypothetical protein
LKNKKSDLKLEKLLRTLYEESFKIEGKDENYDHIYSLFLIHLSLSDIFRNVYHGSCLKNALDYGQDYIYMKELI